MCIPILLHPYFTLWHLLKVLCNDLEFMLSVAVVKKVTFLTASTLLDIDLILLYILC